MSERPWRIDRGLAADVAAALHWLPEDGAGVLARRFAERIPTGSTAKLAALAAGEVPPGADVDHLAQQIRANLTGLASNASADALDGGRDARAESPSWTCWVMSSVFAAIVDTLGPATARVAALRRIDDKAPVVDIHSVVVVEGGHEPGRDIWICDPYFGAAVALPSGTLDHIGTTLEAGPSTEPTTYASAPDEHAGACIVALEGDGRWSFEVRLHGWEGWLRYRVLAPRLDRADLAAFCAISATHSGAPDRPYARLHRRGGLSTLNVDPEGTTTLRLRSWDGPWDGPDGPVAEDLTTVGTWAEGVVAFAAVTGVTIGE